MTSIIDDIEDAMAAGDLNCIVTYGRDSMPTVQNVDELISSYGVARILQAEDMTVDSDIVTSSGNLVYDIAAFMICIHNSAKEAVSALHAWFSGIGFETENGEVGIPPGAPWDFETIRIFQWQPAGGLPLRAEQLGDKWVALVAVNILAYKP